MTLPTISTLPTPPSRSDSPSTFNSAADSFLGAMPTLVSEINAWAAALPANITGTDFSGTSSTSVAIGTGSKSFTASTGKQWQIGQPVRVAYTTTPANYMDGQVTAYNSTTGALTVNVGSVGGSGTYAAWTISLVPSGGIAVTLAGAETLTNKTLTTPVLSATSSGTTAGRIGYSGGVFTGGNGSAELTFATLTSTQTFTNKTIDTAGTNTIKVNGNTLDASAGTATITFFNSSDTVVGRNTTDTLTNKTLSSPTITTPIITGAGTISELMLVVSAGGGATASTVGFRGLPQNPKVTSYTLQIGDEGKHISITTGGVTIPANASVAFGIGTTIWVYNDSGSTQSISITTDTLRLGGTATTGTRTVAAYGLVQLTKVGTTEWVATGNVT